MEITTSVIHEEEGYVILTQEDLECAILHHIANKMAGGSVLAVRFDKGIQIECEGGPPQEGQPYPVFKKIHQPVRVTASFRRRLATEKPVTGTL